jgi:hypothetical protein
MDDREETERRIAKLLRKRKDKFEALAWLNERSEASDRGLSEWNWEESVRMIRQLYDVGAREVWAVEFGRNPPYESIHTLVVTLPDEPAARRAVFGWVNEQTVRQGFEAEEDYGQRHVSVWFD